MNRKLALGFFIFLIVLNIWMLGLGKQPWFVNSLNILFHEAGHWIFALFGEFIGVLGGTLGEMLMPIIFIIYFRIHRRLPGEIFSWWWLSTALYSISIYVADARAQVLPLIGGPGGHDWFYILGRLRLLNADIFISRIFVIAALLVTVYMILRTYHYYHISKKEILL